MGTKRRWVWGVCALGFGGLAACSEGRATGGEPMAPMATVPSREWVTVEALAPERFTPHVTAPGRFELREAATADVATQVGGRVVAVHVLPGDAVKEGDPIATLESPDAVSARFEVQSARAELDAARDAARRQSAMAERGVGLEIERVAAKTRLLQAQSAMAKAERAAALLGEGEGPTVVLRAPRDGTVLERMTGPGAWIGPEDGPVARVGDPDAVWFVAQVFERDLGQVALGARVEIQTTTGARLAGKVARLSRVVEPSTRRAAVHVEIDGECPRAGTWARAEVFGQERESLVLPLEAVLLKGKDSVVYVQEGGELKQRSVRLGERDGQRVEIIDGIAPGTEVVQRGTLLVDSQANQIL